MEEINKPINNTNSFFNLEKSLSPLWKSTYYLGLTFDWCRPISKKSWQSIIIPCFIIFATFVILLYSTSSSALELSKVIRNPESTILAIVINMIIFSDQLILLLAYFYFLFNKSKLQTFFFNWKQMEEQLGVFKGTDPSKMKRTCIIIYTLHYIYNIFFRLFPSICGEIDTGPDDNNSADGNDEDLIASYYPDLVSNPFYVFWVKFQNIFPNYFLVVFCPLIDITPAMVYYHAARMVESMKWEIQELGTNDFSPSNSIKSEILYSLWSRFEALAVLLGRTDKLFGAI